MSSVVVVWDNEANLNTK